MLVVVVMVVLLVLLVLELSFLYSLSHDTISPYTYLPAQAVRYFDMSPGMIKNGLPCSSGKSMVFQPFERR